MSNDANPVSFNFERTFHLFLVVGDFEQIILCYVITFTSLGSNFVTK